MQGNVLDSIENESFFRSRIYMDLTLKVEIGMEFGRFPNFLGNRRSSGIEIGSFEVVSKIFLNDAHSTKWRATKWWVMGRNGLCKRIKNNDTIYSLLMVLYN
ncbi:hypothetical protein LX77_03195 [Gelidibacter algens]|uniref:Uncharacterized protein n=1 Tax=Gelidibacter algens TaxID=49280 RepID=A0A1A7QRM5_9FLAO|nr:hypothetical protein A9996_17230 [Gelidibacter algens]RAJ19982.1 hypothetical protein LX77_03195 [Gelidibacter algens]